MAKNLEVITLHEASAILETDHRNARRLLSENGVEPAQYSNGKPFFRLTAVRKLHASLPTIPTRRVRHFARY